MKTLLFVIDGFGIGECEDSYLYNDQGSNTFQNLYLKRKMDLPNFKKLGLFNIDGLKLEKSNELIGSFGRIRELSAGKDTTTGHWEIAGIVSEKPFPLFPNGFPDEFIKKLEKVWGREIIVNKPYSGTTVLMDYGREHIETGKIIVYTSGDSVLQVACHDSVVSVEELYKMCEQARELCTGEFAVGRVIARPFVGEYPNFVRTHDRKDFSLTPPQKTILNKIQERGMDVISVGKINALFNGYGITESYPTSSDENGMEKTIEIAKNKDFNRYLP